MSKWNVTKVVEGEEVEDYGTFEAENIDDLLNQLKEKFNVQNFYYEEDISSGTYDILEPDNEKTWLTTFEY